MNKATRLALAFGGTVLCLTSALASNQPTTFIGPTLRGGYTAPLSDMTAYSVAGEVGVKNFRIGATLGLKIDQYQRFKVTGEYLWQRINYRFFSGDTERWVNQGAIGARYEYDFADTAYNPQFDINGFYSHAPSDNLGSRSGFITSGGVTSSFIDVRRIAGSNAGGVSPGLSIGPWDGGRVGVDVNYDNVSYNTKNTTNHDAKGWGGTIFLQQVLTNNVVLDLSAADRRPFNDYEGALNWTNVQYYGRWTMGVYGNYLDGKNTLPNTWNLGLSADYFMDPMVTQPMNVKGERNLKGENLKGEVPVVVADPFLDWTADPAVHMPQVLAIPDEEVLRPSCQPGVPSVISTLPPVIVDFDTVTSFDVAAAFSPGSGLTYTVTTTGPLLGTVVTPNSPVPGDVTIDTTGTSGDGTDFTVLVTASNSCGSTTTSFTVHVNGD